MNSGIAESIKKQVIVRNSHVSEGHPAYSIFEYDNGQLYLIVRCEPDEVELCLAACRALYRRKIIVLYESKGKTFTLYRPKFDTGQ